MVENADIACKHRVWNCHGTIPSFAEYFHESIISSYFDLLEQTLSEYDLFSSPSRIYNCDKTGLPLEHTPPRVIGIKGQKHPRSVTTGCKKNITVLACCSASGNVLPPQVIFRRNNLNAALVRRRSTWNVLCSE